MQQDLSRNILSDITIHMKYAAKKGDHRETWKDIVDRNKAMHIKRFPKLVKEIEDAYQYVYEKKVLPSMRSCQFAGKAIEVRNFRIFNCSYLPINSHEAFSEIMLLLLAGTGVGYSVQKHDVDKLPEITRPRREKRFLVEDSIEGWADAVRHLIKAYMGDRKALPLFDFSIIRVRGSKLSSGGKAPGPEPLKTCLFQIQKILDRKEDGTNLTPLECHDIICFIADAVLSGGIRRSACMCLFSFDDEEMLSCKSGVWYELNPQRARANNSAVIVRNKITKEDFDKFWEKIQNGGTGEPGIFWTNSKEWGTNPCSEISLRPNQLCNLTSINTLGIESQVELDDRARAAAFIGTLQAAYTGFHYLREEWKTTTEKEALIGVSLAGIASGNVLQLDLKQAAKVVLEENERIAKLIGINKSARCTTVKPDGTVSLVLGCSSGIHAWHSDYYIRRLRVLKNESIYEYLFEYHPELLEDDYFAPHTQSVISVPQKAPESAITRSEDELALLERVKYVYENWIKPGHRKGQNTHNISCTVSIKKDNWDKVKEWMWENRNYYAAISVFPYDESNYKQPPFEEIDEAIYNKMYAKLQQIDLSQVIERDEVDFKDVVACGGGACEVR
jgi:ribonucleoside-diphosphate reductase alpha chain